MSYWCDNPREHRREGERDYERGGRYGYDSQQYNDHWNDCSKYYREGFDEARRDDERRQERYEEQQREERRQERMAYERRQEERYREAEEEYYQNQEQYYQQEPEPTARQVLRAKIPVVFTWSRKRRRHWLRQKGIKL